MAPKFDVSRRQFISYMGAATGAVVLSACGANGSSGNGSSTDERLAATVAGTFEANASQIPIFVAINKGYFFDEGVEVRKVGMTASAAPAAMLNGSVEMSYQGITGSVLAAANQGQDVVAFAKGVEQNPNIIVVSREFQEASGVSPDAPFQDRALALRGARWGATNPGSGTELTVRYVNTEVGIGEDEYEITFLREIGTFLAAMEQNQIDAFAVFSPIAEAAALQGNGVIWIPLSRGELPAMQDMTWSTMWAQRTALEENRELAERYVRGFWRGLQLIQDDPEEAKAIIRADFGNMDDDVFNLMWENNYGLYPVDPSFTAESVQKSIDFQNFGAEADKVITLDPERVFTNEIVDAVRDSI